MIGNYLSNLLSLANAGQYPGKREVFYPFKYRLLLCYGRFDGRDKQIIQKLCWRCKGTGNFASRCSSCRYEGGCHNCHWAEDDFFGNSDSQCPKCGGSGWFVNKTVWLERWEFRGRVFHVPVETETLPFMIEPPVNIFDGMIKHDPVDNRKAWRAVMILMAIYEVETLAALAWRGILRSFWYSVHKLAYRVRERWEEFRYGDELPF